MIVNGFALEKISTGEEVDWWAEAPSHLNIQDALITVDNPSAGWELGDYRFVNKERVVEDPAPERRLIDKSVIMDRLTDEQLEAALNLMSVRQKERWRMPGYPSVYADDEEVTGLIKAIGADPEIVLK